VIFDKKIYKNLRVPGTSYRDVVKKIDKFFRVTGTNVV
jgi:hypothetical protein